MPEPATSTPASSNTALSPDGERVLVVVTAVDGAEALQTVGRDGCDLAVVLLDIAMPGLSGLEVARVLSRVAPELPVVLTSGYPEPAEEAALRERRR